MTVYFSKLSVYFSKSLSDEMSKKLQVLDDSKVETVSQRCEGYLKPLPLGTCVDSPAPRALSSREMMS